VLELVGEIKKLAQASPSHGPGPPDPEGKLLKALEDDRDDRV